MRAMDRVVWRSWLKAATDNINRTYPDIRLAFTKHGGSLAEKGAVAFQFARKGVIRTKGSNDDILMQALDAGAEDAQEEDGETVIYTEPHNFAKVRDSLKSNGLEIIEAELTYVPNATVTINGAETAHKIIRLMDALEALDDVTNTHVNFEIPQEIMAE